MFPFARVNLLLIFTTTLLFIVAGCSSEALGSPVLRETQETTSQPAIPDANPSVIPPKPVEAPNPEYTPEARSAHIQGSVIVKTIIGRDGVPRDFQIIKSLGYGLDEKAVEALRKWRFKPATRNSENVDFWANIEMRFRLGNNLASESQASAEGIREHKSSENWLATREQLFNLNKLKLKELITALCAGANGSSISVSSQAVTCQSAREVKTGSVTGNFRLTLRFQLTERGEQTNIQLSEAVCRLGNDGTCTSVPYPNAYEDIEETFQSLQAKVSSLAAH